MAAPCGMSNAAVSVNEEQEEQEEQEWRAYPGGNNWWYSDEQSSATSKVKDDGYDDTRNAKEGCYWGGQEEWYADGNWWPANPSIKTEAWGTENGSGAAKQSKKRKNPAEEIGLDLSAYHPKEAVRRFFTRYCSGPATTTDYYYDSPGYEPGVVARLITPSFYSRVFVGEPLRTKKDREESAAKVFCEDPQVIEAAKNLPPPIKKCKQLLSGAATQHAPSVAVARGRVNGDSARSLYASICQANGCRNMFEDGNA